jgi:NADH-quinone oxidoreductase subunit N
VDQAVKSIVDAFGYMLPEVVLVATACVLFLLAPFFQSDESSSRGGARHRFGALSLLALAFAAWLWLDGPPLEPPGGIWSGPFRGDQLAWFIRALTLSVGAVLVLISWNQFAPGEVGESQACLLLILAGVNLTAAANDLVGLFLALELVSIPTYVLLYLVRSSSAGQEAVVKYFLLSVFSSTLLLYGFSFLYGAAGTTNLEAIRVGLVNAAAAPPMILAVALMAVIAGVGFRVTAVPFHFYAPDVFQGTHAAAAGMLSVVPKLAGFVVLLRLIAIVPAAVIAVPHGMALSQVLTPALWWLAVITMSFGNVVALWQTNVRRLLAYSSIAHGGYMLVGLTIAQSHRGLAGGMESLLFYLAVYAAMTVGAFAVLISVSGRERQVETLDDLAGLGRLRPGLALLMAIFLFSLTGLPPTAGFFGKFNLLVAAWSAGTFDLQVLAVIMAVNAAIGAAYYLRIVGAMYLRPAPAAPQAASSEFPAFLGSLLCAGVTLALFLAPQWLWDLVAQVN